VYNYSIMRKPRLFLTRNNINYEYINGKLVKTEESLELPDDQDDDIWTDLCNYLDSEKFKQDFKRRMIREGRLPKE